MSRKNVFPLSSITDSADKNTPVERPKLMVSIVERGKGKAIMNLYNKEGVNFHYQTIGHGTATSEIMDILGLDSKDKDIIISISTQSRIELLIYKMSDELRGAVDTRGILFDLPVTGMTNRIATALNIQLGVPADKRNNRTVPASNEEEANSDTNNQDQGKDVTAMSTEKKYSLILITVNQGYTENVLDFARNLGARGGTVFRARWSGDKAYEQHGINLQAEKEVIAIVVPNDIRNPIMDGVNTKYGIHSKAQATVCSMNVDHFAPIC